MGGPGPLGAALAQKQVCVPLWHCPGGVPRAGRVGAEGVREGRCHGVGSV